MRQTGFVVLGLCVINSYAAAQSARPEVQAHRLAEGESIFLDGIPDEAAWQRAAPATDFRQRDPDNGAPATEKTEVLVIFDKARMILGVTCFESGLGWSAEIEIPFKTVNFDPS